MTGPAGGGSEVDDPFRPLIAGISGQKQHQQDAPDATVTKRAPVTRTV